MRLTSNVFDWKNVPKALVVIAVIVSGVMLWGIAQPSLFGQQPLMLPFVIIAMAAMWFFVYWSGTRKTRVNAGDEPIHPTPHEPEEMPDFQEYMAAEQWMEQHPGAMPAAMPPKKGSHHYDARV